MGDSRIEQVARAVSDGSTVDWLALERSSEASDRARLRQLRALAELTGSGLEAPATHHTPVSLAFAAAIVGVTAGAQILMAVCTFLAQLIQHDQEPLAVLRGSVAIALITCAAMLLTVGRDGRAINLALFLLILGSASSRYFFEEYPAEGPWAVLTRGTFPDAFLPLFAWAFVRDFPRVIRFSRLDTVSARGVQLSAAVGAVLFLSNVLLVWTPDLAHRMRVAAFERGGASPYWGIVFALFVPSIVVMLARIRQAAVVERRRVKLFLYGIGAGLMPLIVFVGLELAFPAFDRFTSRPAVLFVVDSAIYGGVLSIPFVTTYSVLVDHVLPAHIIIRNTLRYALARQTLVAASAAPVLVLLYSLFTHRNLTIAEVGTRFESRVAAVLALAALGLSLARARILRVLNRRYFRDEIDIGRALGRLTDGLTDARDRRQVAELLEGALEHAIQVTEASLFLPAGTHYSPVRGRGSELQSDSALLTLIQASSDPLDLNAGGLLELLPRRDRQWVERNNVAAMVAVTHGGVPLGLITVGHRRSDLPFSRDVATFLSAAAASAALALRGLADGPDAARRGSEVESPPAAECQTCTRVTNGDAEKCDCGGTLRTSSLPRVLSGKFEVTHWLGAGGMGIVYRARDLTLGREVALKTLPRLTAAAADRLTREAQSMARVAGTTLAAIYGVERWRGSPVLVIELLEGGTLAERLSAGALPIEEAVSIARRILVCLESLHEGGLVHRDIKPANIGFTGSGQLKLLDFGLAAIGQPAAFEKEAGPESSGEDLSAFTSVAGTPLYLPPEAFEGAAPTPAFDVWAAAMVLYESIAGRHPWRGHATIRFNRRPRIPEIRSIRPACPRQLSELLARALSNAPEKRPAGARQFAIELAQTIGADRRIGTM